MDSPNSLYFTLGIVLSIVGNILVNIALNIQRHAHNQQQKDHWSDPDHSRWPQYLRSGWWWFGAVIMTVGETGNFVAYGFAPASVVSPLGVFALLSNCIVAPVFFKEPTSRRKLYGVAVAIAGILFITLSAETGGDSPTPAGDAYDPYHAIMSAISQTSFKIYCLVTGALILIVLIAVDTSGEKAAETPSLFANVFLVAVFGGYTALATKGLSSLLSFTFARALSYKITYILLAVIALTALCQVVFINRALRHFDATLVVPVHFVLFTLSVITGSAVTYHDFEKKTTRQLASFFFGCFLTFIGVWLITSRSATDTANNHFDDHNDDEDIDRVEEEEYERRLSEPGSPVQSRRRESEALLTPVRSRSDMNEYNTITSLHAGSGFLSMIRSSRRDSASSIQ